MNKKQELLIQKLQSDPRPISSAELAKELGVTSRSIKNYVNSINKETPGLILSGPRGYQLDKKVEITTPASGVPQTYQERSYSIIKKFFFEHMESIDLYDLCDEFYLGYSSIKLLISKMNKDLSRYRLALHVQNDCVFLEGAESDRRKFLTSLIYQESSGGLVNLATLKELFTDLDVEYIYPMLHETFKHYEYYIHDFAYSNITLHLIVILYQTRNHRSLQKTQEPAGEAVMDVTRDIVTKLEAHFQVSFSPQECVEMDKLIYANLCVARANSEQELRQIVGQEIYDTTLHIIERLNRHYGLHLDRTTLLSPLALHLKNLFARYRNGTYLKNPMLESLQKTCPKPQN